MTSGHRIEFFYRLWPKYYPSIVGRLTHSPERVAEAERFHAKFAGQVRRDLERLTALQQEDGSWGFDLGLAQDKGNAWRRLEEPGDPAPTAVALIGLEAAGFGPEDSRIKRATKWLLADQYPYGLWNISAQTGFVTTAYVIRALSRLYPKQPEGDRQSIGTEAEKNFARELSRIRRIQAAGDPRRVMALIEAANNPHAQIPPAGPAGPRRSRRA